jgi:hypothetical protein
MALILPDHASYGFSAPTSSSRMRTPAARAIQRVDFIPYGQQQQQQQQQQSIPLQATLLSEETKNGHDKERSTLRIRLKRATGFSLTAIRRTMRTATGISMTAVYASTMAATGAWIRQTMKVILSIFPAWFRYFVQPFLILYYTPLIILKSLTSPSRKQAKLTHETFLEELKEAVETADSKSSYWPVHLGKDGSLEKDFDEVDMSDAIAESMEIAMEAKTPTTTNGEE